MTTVRSLQEPATPPTKFSILLQTEKWGMKIFPFDTSGARMAGLRLLIAKALLHGRVKYYFRLFESPTGEIFPDTKVSFEPDVTVNEYPTVEFFGKKYFRAEPEVFNGNPLFMLDLRQPAVA